MARKKPTRSDLQQNHKPEIPPSEKKPETVEVQVPIRWKTEGVPIQYVNNLLVLHDEGDFHLMFFQRTPPILIGSDEEVASKLRKLESVSADCVAHLVVNEKKLPSFIKAMAANFSRNVIGDKQEEEEKT